MKNWKEVLEKFSVKPAIAALRFYQKTVSPQSGVFLMWWGGAGCRFYPSCSEYAISALRQYGLFSGSVVSLKRILRCNPFCKGGHDPL